MDIAVVTNLYFYQTVEVFNKILIPHYGNVVDGDNYFTRSLRGECWHSADLDRKVAALTDATRLIDALNFIGTKTVDDQPLQFPRTIVTRKRASDAMVDFSIPFDNSVTDFSTPLTRATPIIQTIVPKNIETACYEIALCLLDGYDPDLEIENLGSTSQGLGAVRDTFTRDFVLDHVRAGIPSAKAWANLKPYLVDSRTIRMRRVD